MFQRSWHFLPILLWLSIVSSLAQATQARATTPQPASKTLAQVVEPCEYGGFPKFYARITTNEGDTLNIRANPSPSGAVIGAAPHGWAVRVLSWSRDGAWARITDHFGGGAPLGGAPSLREGWVSAAYLKDLGRFCDKPVLNDGAVGQLMQPELLGSKPVEVQRDRLATGDILSAMLPNTHLVQPQI
ncbi:MAG: SH3 domain-containing protein [Spirulina sp. SIO3F2]|nr:SH3 domain-containing protein [Spirulina sp. SIO3F2]